MTLENNLYYKNAIYMPNEVACAFSVLFFYVLSFCLGYVTAIPYYVISLTVLDISRQQPYRKHMSVMRKPIFCKCENKDADQLRGYREADQRLCFSLHG